MSVIVEQDNVISTLNSRAAADLAPNAIFQGVGEDVHLFGRAGVSVSSSNKSDGTLYMQVSRDGINYGGPPRMWADTRFAQPHMWELVESHFRILYVNGNSIARDLVLQTQYSVNGGILLGHQLDEILLDETEAIVTRSVLVGKSEDGNYLNAGMTPDGLLQVESTDKFTYLLTEMLTEQRRTNKFLEVISGFEMIDEVEDF